MKAKKPKHVVNNKIMDPDCWIRQELLAATAHIIRVTDVFDECPAKRALYGAVLIVQSLADSVTLLDEQLEDAR